MLGIETSVASPPGYGPSDLDVERVLSAGGKLTVTSDPIEAVQGSDVVYTDVWTSMGQESERSARLDAFGQYRVDAALMSRASNRSLFMHCLPVHRGEEVTNEVIEGPRSKVFVQAENRMHSARGLLVWLAQQVMPA